MLSAFGLGTLVFNGLEMAMHSMMEGSCLNDVVFVHPVLHGLFTFLQMHFLFVNSQVSFSFSSLPMVKVSQNVFASGFGGEVRTGGKIRIHALGSHESGLVGETDSLGKRKRMDLFRAFGSKRKTGIFFYRRSHSASAQGIPQVRRQARKGHFFS